MLMMPGIEKQFDGPADVKGMVSLPTTHANGPKIMVQGPKCNGRSNSSSLKFLIYGQTGWIGGLLGDICRKQGIPYSMVEVDSKTALNFFWIFKRLSPHMCSMRLENGLLMMNYATGCIFEYDTEHPEGSGIGFKEEDKPNFSGSFYSKTKAMVEELLKEYDNVCTLRVRMPISSDLSNPRNFITKITRYNKVVNIPNSMTILDELLPISVEMAKRNCSGIWNFTNPGVVSHNEILEMYKKYIDPEFSWLNFTLEEQAKVIVAPRSNNEMDASKLKNEFPELLPIKESLIKFVFEPNRKL
ncbi:hypothetical protein HPP92_002452 [Vanilla planifolia]|uniref:Uncharacterized protein n=1 Tax=Vanilla planifolia TaxID=51239 RepID=A0A835S8J7_VANPL|nr:hypothetical protein HPP92_002452 [Vanilla planifolia]